jgi:hypothetical protein
MGISCQVAEWFDVKRDDPKFVTIVECCAIFVILLEKYVPKYRPLLNNLKLHKILAVGIMTSSQAVKVLAYL